MAAQEILSGVQYHRINRQPLDYESVVNTYSDIEQNILSDGHNSTYLGQFYAGMYTAVVDDSDKTKNGPYYISYVKTGTPDNTHISYEATRIPLATEISYLTGYWETSYNNLHDFCLREQAYLRSSYEYCRNSYEHLVNSYNNLHDYAMFLEHSIYQLLEQPKYTKPEISVQFVSAATKELTPITGNEVIIEDTEIGTLFTSGIKVNWPARTADNPNGTRAYDNIGDPTIKPNELLGYSYGLNGNGISFLVDNVAKTSNVLDSITYYTPLMVTNEDPLTVFDDVKISYLESSYMYYPQFARYKRYEKADGENNTTWFDKGEYIPATKKYIVNGKYRYYWGFTNNLPINKGDLQLGESGLLNSSKFLNGTTTSQVVGDGYDKKYFYIAFPSKFALVEYKENLRIALEQGDGMIFDLISHNQNMKLKKMTILLGDSNITDEYNLAFAEFSEPIGNPGAVVSFRIIPANSVEYIFNITAENGKAIRLEESDDILRTETSNNIIYDEVFS